MIQVSVPSQWSESTIQVSVSSQWSESMIRVSDLSPLTLSVTQIGPAAGRVSDSIGPAAGLARDSDRASSELQRAPASACLTPANGWAGRRWCAGGWRGSGGGGCWRWGVDGSRPRTPPLRSAAPPMAPSPSLDMNETGIGGWEGGWGGQRLTAAAVSCARLPAPTATEVESGGAGRGGGGGGRGGAIGSAQSGRDGVIWVAPALATVATNRPRRQAEAVA